eukprot:m.126742 g.126742  ORF g.126742 m.126742 type:complete len:73 (+) comp17387_c0_seq1:1400-1618(+)
MRGCATPTPLHYLMEYRNIAPARRETCVVWEYAHPFTTAHHTHKCNMRGIIGALYTARVFVWFSDPKCEDCP